MPPVHSPREQCLTMDMEIISERGCRMPALSIHSFLHYSFHSHSFQFLYFTVFFRDLLKVSHHNFHQMFTNTYGYLYDKHAAIFNDMFRDLNYYYSTGSVDLSVSLKQFFSLLYKKMFVELNSSYAMDGSYLECTLEHMEEMMPFGEMPQKLIQQIKRSFIAIRTFVQALNYGNEVLKNIMDVSREREFN